uniref:ETS domain-containing protein n=1 Tax=Strongyloides papillosus TaxID=174720 RepID=A0A0N5CF86_STREA
MLELELLQQIYFLSPINFYQKYLQNQKHIILQWRKNNGKIYQFKKKDGYSKFKISKYFKDLTIIQQ